MCRYIYVSLYKCVAIYMCCSVAIYVSLCVAIYMCCSVAIYVSLCVAIYIHRYVYVRGYKHTSLYMCVPTYIHRYICMSLHTYIAIYMCRYVWLHTYHRYIYVSPCTYIATFLCRHISFVWLPSSGSSVALTDKPLTKTSCVIRHIHKGRESESESERKSEKENTDQRRTQIDQLCVASQLSDCSVALTDKILTNSLCVT